jgi:hypothetical protein
MKKRQNNKGCVIGKTTMPKLLLLFCLSLLSLPVFSQLKDSDKIYFNKYQDTLQQISKKLFVLKNDSLKLLQNKKFSDKLEEVLLNELSFYFDFDSLKKDLQILKSEDNKVRIISWDINLKDGTYQYFGFIQSKNSKTGKYETFELNDVSETVKNAETYNGDHTKWYGMLYYKLIDCDNYYTLLGWDGNDKLTTKKIVDVLSFKPDGSPLFGKNVFTNIPKKYPKRLIVEFSGEGTISLKYHDKKNLIVYNHVAPPDPYLEGMYQYYVPDGSFDGLEYKRGNWTYVPDVDIKNIGTPNDKVRKPKTKEKPMYVPH